MILRRLLPAILLGLCCATTPAVSSAAAWQAGAAKLEITPEGPLWMAGYASRTKPAEGKLSPLWAKALAIADPAGKTAVLVTLDLCGIDRALSVRMAKQIQTRHKLPRAAVALCISHTHSGPVVGENLRTMYFLDEEQGRRVDAYTKWLEGRVDQVVADALSRLADARLSWSVGRSTFAVNRRTNKEATVPGLRETGGLLGPVDHDVPVLQVRTAAGQLTAVVFGYACHATVLSGYEWSGDWPGFAQEAIEADQPGVTALFFAGCGADQNPIPRRTTDLARQYGRQMANAVAAELVGTAAPIAGELKADYAEIDLPLGELPSQEQLQHDTQSKDRYLAARAKHLLAQLERNGKLAATYPYPVQTWVLGDAAGGGLQWAFLGGEVVVDFSLRLKQETSERRTWIAAYANDVMAYIPSRRVLLEGGYEGGGAMVYYGLPSPWALEVEERIVREVRRQLGRP